jgi:hypothetical protein
MSQDCTVWPAGLTFLMEVKIKGTTYLVKFVDWMKILVGIRG